MGQGTHIPRRDRRVLVWPFCLEQASAVHEPAGLNIVRHRVGERERRGGRRRTPAHSRDRAGQRIARSVFKCREVDRAEDGKRIRTAGELECRVGDGMAQTTLHRAILCRDRGRRWILHAATVGDRVGLRSDRTGRHALHAQWICRADRRRKKRIQLSGEHIVERTGQIQVIARARTRREVEIRAENAPLLPVDDETVWQVVDQAEIRGSGGSLGRHERVIGLEDFRPGDDRRRWQGDRLPVLFASHVHIAAPSGNRHRQREAIDSLEIDRVGTRGDREFDDSRDEREVWWVGRLGTHRKRWAFRAEERRRGRRRGNECDINAPGCAR